MPSVVYLVLVAFLAGLAGGWKVESWRWDASLKSAADARYSAVVRVRDADQALQRLATVAGGRAEAMLTFQREKARAINLAINETLAALPECVIPGRVVGLLDDATRAAASPPGPGPPGQPGPPQSPVDPAPDSTCAAQLDICARNYSEVAIPNAIERDEIRRLYNEVKTKINGPP